MRRSVALFLQAMLARAYPRVIGLRRMPGWIAQWLEMRHDPATRIGRPR